MPASLRRTPTVTDTHPRRAEGLEITETEDGLVVYDPAHDMVHHLNQSAAVIFDLCDGSRDLRAIALVLAEAYELSSPPLEDARAGLDELVERNLVRWDTHAGADS